MMNVEAMISGLGLPIHDIRQAVDDHGGCNLKTVRDVTIEIIPARQGIAHAEAHIAHQFDRIPCQRDPTQ